MISIKKINESIIYVRNDQHKTVERLKVMNGRGICS